MMNSDSNATANLPILRQHEAKSYFDIHCCSKIEIYIPPNDAPSTAPSIAIYGRPGSKHEVLYSADLKDWKVLETIIVPSDDDWPNWGFYSDETAPPKQGHRFYKMRLVE